MSVLATRLRRLGRRLVLSWKAFAILGLVVGLAVAPYAYTAATEPDSTVAVIPLEGGIEGPMAYDVTAQLQEARADPSIEAVVLLSNSPGGSAAASETLYLAVARTAERMPVVGHVDAMAASGAYYALAPSHHIVGKPSSLVGSVGVFVTTPQDPQPIDEVIATGPNKLSGGDERDWMHKTESLRNAFVGAVLKHRDDRLRISEAEVSEAGLYTGGQAVENGMMDEIGSLRDAIREAADRADLRTYDVEVLRSSGDGNDSSTKFMTRANYVASDAPDKELVSPAYFVGELGDDPAMPHVVMLPPSIVVSAAEGDELAAVAANGTTVESGQATSANESTGDGREVIG